MTQRGMPTQIPTAVRAQMVEWSDAGWSQAKIADRLNADGVATPRGASSWYAQSVRQVVVAERRRRESAAAIAPDSSASTVLLQFEARCPDADLVHEFVAALRLLAGGAGARDVEILVDGRAQADSCDAMSGVERASPPII
ncbi:MAG: recombinase family protein [Sporichthyaceae bacterium]